MAGEKKAYCIVISMFQTWEESLTGYDTLCIQTSACYPGLSGPGECKTNFELPQISILKITEKSVLPCTCLLQTHANNNTLKITGKKPRFSKQLPQVQSRAICPENINPVLPRAYFLLASGQRPVNYKFFV